MGLRGHVEGSGGVERDGELSRALSWVLLRIETRKLEKLR